MSDPRELLACPLCGGRFQPSDQTCGACPFARGCRVACCPHCGYQFPTASRLVDWIAERIEKIRRHV